MANVVAIVGRPNVGKSTFFNRLVESRTAIMDNESGVTRDRQYGVAEWNGKMFTAIDTGGYVTGSNDVFEGAIREQVKIALEEASVIIFMVDTKAGLTGLDTDFGNILRELKKPVFIAANKADTTELVHLTGEFYAMGFKEIFPISSSNGSGTGELLDAVAKELDDEEVDRGEGIPRLAILGRPNVGKSSFLNALVGEDRSIVTDEAGTTRDAINTRYTLFGKDFILTDTAGLRKKTKVKDNLEFYSVLRSLQALQDSDVCIILVDATRGLESQDINIISLADKYGKGIMLMVNKWDLVDKETNTAAELKKVYAEKLGLLNYMPIVFTSVTEKQRIFKAIETAIEVNNNRSQKISTSKLNDAMLPEIENYPPPAIKGKYIKIKYVTQLPTVTPSFAFFCNLPQYVKSPYKRFLENKLRDKFNLKGSPIRVYLRKK
ncbi:MAG: ribosome biogenesis GTPase Der [Bacteroidetes bacterium]|nr:MAG: ribosome biogenesis GTPase Der [Bacteroidota bacterium]